MSGQFETPARQSNPAATGQNDHGKGQEDQNLHGAQSEYLSHFGNDAQKSKSSSRRTYLYRHTRTRNVFSTAIENIFKTFYTMFFALGNKTERLLAGFISPAQARTISIYATTLLLALVTLIFCREINLYCFRSVAHNENAVSIFRNATSQNCTSSARDTSAMLSQSRSII